MEFALVAPIFFLVVFGIIEFGWIFAQHLDVRHGTREASRLVAVNFGEDDGDQTQAIVDEVCARMDFAEGIEIELSLHDPDSNEVGDRARVELGAEAQQITGFLEPILGGVDLASTIDVRLEQDATWDEGVYTCA